VNPLVLPAPSGLTATALTRNSIRLTWTNGSTGQTEVQVERCQGLGCTSFSQVGAVAGTATTFTDSGLAPRTKYRYRVRARSALGDSLYSNTASARTKR
jgi:chitodextrinase